MIQWSVAVLALALAQCQGACILAFLPLYVTSHQNTYRPIFRQLAKLGHDVTFVTSLPDVTANYRQIVIENGDVSPNKTDFIGLRKNNWLDDTFLFTKLNEDSVRNALRNPNVQQLIASPDEHFDLVFTESTLLQYAYIALGHRFNAHVIEIQAICSNFFLYHLIGNPYSFSYSVEYNTYTSDRMSFVERLHNTVMGVTTSLLHRYYILPRHQDLADRYLRYPGWENRPGLLELYSNVSLVILNTHIATHYPHPYNPNVIEVAGIQIPEKKKLPPDLQTFLDNAKEGVVYFSMGSAIQGSKLPRSIIQSFISAFRKLRYKVLWKWETDAMPDQPENVKLSKWFPQSDVLSHPSIQAFITHGGINSLTETVYHGVPALMIPLFLDQWKNSKQMESAGYGVILDFDSITEESITLCLESVVSQHSYREAARRQSMILRDNPMPPVDKAVYWIEYVLRHKGAPHLRTAAASLPWYKYYLIYVVPVLMSCILLVVVVLYLSIRVVYMLLFGNNTERIHKKLPKKEN